MSDGTLVSRLREEVADRRAVDWTGLLSELHSGEAPSPELLGEVSLLQVLDEIGQAHVTLQSEAIGDAEPMLAGALADDTLEAWGRYVLEAKVGRGGFGSVYRAWDPVLEMPVALKILHRRFSDDRLKERLLHEGRALAQLRHPNVVRVLNVEQHDGRLGLVMEFLSGETMDALVAAHGQMNDGEASVVVADVCRALAAVHANGLIHRDVKARNIIREPTGRIVLMDFGAGLSMRSADAPGAAVGTPLYMSPETLNGAAATPASDVYGVGVLLFFLVSGRYPYEGGTFDEIRDAHTARRANSLLGLRPDLPVRFVKVVERALAIDIAARYPTPDALLQALADLSGERRSLWARVRPGILAGVALLAVMTVGGMLSSVAYNAALGRAAYQSDTFLQKIGWGAQALFLPIVLTCLAAGLAGAAIAVRRVVTAASAGARTLERRWEERGRRVAVRLALTEPAVCASWLLLVTIACTAVIWVYWTPLLLAVTTDIGSAPRDILAVLSPALTPYRTGYRMALSVLVAGNIAGWFLLRRVSGGREPLPAWIVATEVSLIVLLLLSMQLPYRLLHHIERADAVTWRGQQCYAVGEGPTDDLLYCSRMSPRLHVVPRGSIPLSPSSPKEHPFAPFSPGAR